MLQDMLLSIDQIAVGDHVLFHNHWLKVVSISNPDAFFISIKIKDERGTSEIFDTTYSTSKKYRVRPCSGSSHLEEL